MKLKLCALLLLVVFIGTAQRIELQGFVKDKQTATALESATVYLQTIKDTTLLTYAVSDTNGFFEMEANTKNKEAFFVISYTGYQQIRKKIPLSKRKIDLGTFLLEEAAQMLAGVEVVGEKAPITIKKDTLEFNANAFKTRPDANVEDLLKKLPGVEIDEDGKITVNGKEVNEILVNGKPFFGNDPKIATKNISKDIVSKIQVSDTKTETQKFTGKKSNNENQSINITLKKGKNKGVFGRITAGYGSDERYEFSGIGNYFKDNRRLSVLASANNINVSGFSYNEIYDMMGSGNSGLARGNGGRGITTSSTAGANFVDDLGEGKDISVDYFFSGSDTQNDSKTARENLLPDSKFFTNSTSSFNSTNDNHRSQAQLKMQLSEKTRLIIRPSYNFTKSTNNGISESESLQTNGTLVNTSGSARNAMSQRKNVGNNLSLISKVGTKGSFVSVDFGHNFLNNQSDNQVQSFNEVYDELGQLKNRTDSDQLTANTTQQNTVNFGVEFRQPLAEKLFVDVEYDYSQVKRENEKNVFNKDQFSEMYEDLDLNLSSDLRYDNTVHNPQIGLNYETEKVNFGLNTGLRKTRLKNQDFLQNVAFQKDFEDVSISGHLRMRFGKGKRIRLSYSNRNILPTVAQLQPVEDQSNLANIVTGNPELERALSHRARVSFSNYNYKTRSGFFMYGFFDATNNAITNITTTDENLLRRTTYTNVDGNYNGGSYLSYSKTIKKDSSAIRYRFGVRASLGKNNGFSNAVPFYSKVYSLGPRIGLSYNYKELLQLEPSYNLNYSNTNYSLENLQDESLMTHVVALRASSYWPKNIVFANDIRYNYNPDVGEGFDKGILFWNLSLGLKMMKDKGTVNLKVYDLLNQNNNTRRIVTADYIQDSQSSVLTRYFMMSFTYKLNKIGGKSSRGGRYGRYRRHS